MGDATQTPLSPPPAYGAVMKGYSRQQSVEQEEVVLYSNIKERRKWDQLGDLFAILKVVEHLESARIKSAVDRDAYTSHCGDLISRYKDLQGALSADGSITSTADFAEQYGMDVPYAMERLVKYGVPATVLHKNHGQTDASSHAKQAAEVTQCFITAMDALKLGQRAVDEVQPVMTDLVGHLNKCERVADDFVGLEKARNWLVALNAMRASDELTDEQIRQLLHDLDVSYGAFFESLEVQTKKRGA